MYDGMVLFQKLPDSLLTFGGTSDFLKNKTASAEFASFWQIAIYQFLQSLWKGKMINDWLTADESVKKRSEMTTAAWQIYVFPRTKI